MRAFSNFLLGIFISSFDNYWLVSFVVFLLIYMNFLQSREIALFLVIFAIEIISSLLFSFIFQFIFLGALFLYCQYYVAYVFNKFHQTFDQYLLLFSFFSFGFDFLKVLIYNLLEFYLGIQGEVNTN